MNLKKYLPVESFTLKTALSIEDVRKRLLENTTPRKRFSFTLFKDNPTEPYEGDVTENTFRISRIISYQNSFLPLVSGKFENYLGQTLVTVKMRLFTPVRIFMYIWMGGVSFAGIAIVLAALSGTKTKGMPAPVALLFPIIMFLFGWALTFFAFKFESKKSKQFLLSALEAEETQDFNFK